MQLPDVEAQKAFYEAQIEELEKITLQNYFTKCRTEKRLEIAKEEDDRATQVACEAELEKVELEFKTADLYIAVAKEQLAKL